MAGDNLLKVNDEGFEKDVLKSELPVLVDFWAEWCGPCRAVAPTIEALAAEYSGKVRVAKMDVDANPQTPAKFGIRAIPTLILFQNGEIAEKIVGAVGKAQIENAIKKLL